MEYWHPAGVHYQLMPYNNNCNYYYCYYFKGTGTGTADNFMMIPCSYYYYYYYYYYFDLLDPLPPEEESRGPRLLAHGGPHNRRRINNNNNNNNNSCVPPKKLVNLKSPKLVQAIKWRPKKSTSTEIANTINSNIASTVMIRNIPNRLRRDFMLEFLDKYCKEYSLEYDFFYLPMDFKTKNNRGYAFVNFTNSVAALKFKSLLHNFEWRTVRINSEKKCELDWARIQGKDALVKRYKGSIFTCDRWDYLPLVLDPPRNGLDPNPAPPIILGSLHRRPNPALKWIRTIY